MEAKVPIFKRTCILQIQGVKGVTTDDGFKLIFVDAHNDTYEFDLNEEERTKTVGELTGGVVLASVLPGEVS